MQSPSSGKDPNGACFCQARTHPLSKYTPLCLQCGLVLCTLHAPYYPCPHCASQLTTPTAREALIQRITAEIAEVIAREHEQRERERQAVQQAAGAFPSLGSSTGRPQASIPTQPRKVLSLNAQTRKVMVASYAPAPPATQTRSGADPQSEPERRVPPPPKEVDYVRGKGAEGRRWQNLRDEGIVYVRPPAPRHSNAEGSRSGRRKKKKAADSNTT